MNRKQRKLLTGMAGAILPAAWAGAIPLTVTAVDTPGCDVLSVPANVEELGISFPLGERIDAATIGFSPPACPSSALAGPHYRIRITNFNSVTFNNVWYVADSPITRITNEDGLVNGCQAFRIDNNAGDLNKPLVLESINPNGLFEPGEQWEFIIDDFTNAFGLPPHLINQVGVPSPGANGSTGNIIATPVPEPSTIGVLVLAGCALVARRRKH